MIASEIRNYARKPLSPTTNKRRAAIPSATTPNDRMITIAADAAELPRGSCPSHRNFPASGPKNLRRFSSGEAAQFIGINEGYLRQWSLKGRGPACTSPTAVGAIQSKTLTPAELISTVPAKAPADTFHTRRDGEELQVISVMNFKGGSGKTTTAAHLAQYLALRGYRVLAIDLDPQASLSALLGHQPEFDVGENETLYGAIRYDDERREMPTRSFAAPTFRGSTSFPASSN